MLSCLLSVFFLALAWLEDRDRQEKEDRGRHCYLPNHTCVVARKAITPSEWNKQRNQLDNIYNNRLLINGY